MAKPAKRADRRADEDAPESAADWLKEIDQALKREKTWREKGKKVVQRYRDERDAASSRSRVNILWSNTEVLKAALFTRTAKPDVRRRFPDTTQTSAVSRAAAEVLERGIAYANDVEDVDDPIRSAIEDMLLPGRGTCWVSYEPEIEGDDYGIENAPETDTPAITPPRIASQTLRLEYVYWEDYCQGKARKWCDIPWVGRRHVLRKDQFTAKFPNAKEGAKLAYKLEDASGDNEGEGGDTVEHVEIWEIWDKPTMRRLYIGRGYADVLQSDDDPYGLNGFFPCPRPLTGVTTTDRQIPTPEFLQYQDQANELDTIATRVNRLLEQLQFKGVYDATIGGDKGPLSDVSKAGDGEFVAFEQFNAMRDKGGIESAFGFWPIERIPPVVQQLTDRAMRLTQQIYEVTGISDIIRGATDPNETKGAQQLKAQFGSMRMQARQRDVQRFIRDCYRMMAEIIAEHFTEETLREITGLTFEPLFPSAPPPPAQSGPVPQPMTAPPALAQGGAAPPMQGMNPAQPMPGEMPQAGVRPTWEGVMRILRSDKLRSYRIDIETDATVFEDAEAEKASRIEFMQAVNEMLEKAYLAATTAPMMLPLIRETFLFGIRSFKVGRALEQSAEDAFDQLIKNPPAPPAQEAPAPTGPDPEVEKAKLAIEDKKVTQEGAFKFGSLDIEREKLGLEKARVVAEQQAATMVPPTLPDPKVELDRERLQIERENAAHARMMAERDMAIRIAAQNKQIMAEANEEMAGEGAPMPEGQLAAASPIEMMLASIRELAAVVAHGQQAEQAQIAALTEALTAPKRIVRGADGRAVGVETAVTLQ